MLVLLFDKISIQYDSITKLVAILESFYWFFNSHPDISLMGRKVWGLL